MNEKKWYSDDASQLLHKLLSDELAPIIARLCPNYELSHLGINRDFNTEEITLKLHINPFGKITVRPSEKTEEARRLRARK